MLKRYWAKRMAQKHLIKAVLARSEDISIVGSIAGRSEVYMSHSVIRIFRPEYSAVLKPKMVRPITMRNIVTFLREQSFTKRRFQILNLEYARQPVKVIATKEQLVILGGQEFYDIIAQIEKKPVLEVAI